MTQLAGARPVGTARLGLTVERATDNIFVLLGPLDYEEFVTRRGCIATGWHMGRMSDRGDPVLGLRVKATLTVLLISRLRLHIVARSAAVR